MTSDETIRKVTGMEHAIEQAARLIYQLRHPGGDPIGGLFDGPSWAEIETRDAQATARALAEAGLLAPSPLREEWGSEMRNARSGDGSHVLRARDRDNARWQIENNPEWATGNLARRYVTDWGQE